LKELLACLRILKNDSIFGGMKTLLSLIIILSLSIQIHAQNNFGFVNTDKVRYDFFDSAMNATEEFVRVTYLRKATKTDTSQPVSFRLQ
jgi:hypothetical protein